MFGKKGLIFVFTLSVALLVLASCASQDTSLAPESDTVGINDDGLGNGGTAEITEGHIGCQEGEIGVDGECRVAEADNASLFGQELNAELITEEISNGAKGYLAKPAEAGNYPGVVMIHEWWGLNDNIREMARLLASQGYVVFAVDLYGVPAASESAEARELATAVRNDPEKAVADMKAAVNYLKQSENITGLASLGWCFGGQHSLLLSVNEWLDATVVYYGSLISDREQLKNIRGPVLGIFGENDSSIPLDSVRLFEENLEQLGIENDIYIYDGLGHAFANPSGSNYAPEQTRDAWQKTVNFLDENLKNNKAIADETSLETVIFKLSGENFAFFMDGEEAPVLRVKEGDKVRIEFESTEGFHNWVIDEFGAATQAVGTGNPTFVEFVADKKGSFEYYCSVGSHRQQGMVGTLIVE